MSKEEYDTCRITNPKPRIIAVCDRPDRLLYFTITFRSFTPQPGGLEFRPGQDYYFICEYIFFIFQLSEILTFVLSGLFADDIPGDQFANFANIFAATSSRDDLHRRTGGHCKSHNMKVVFKVCCKNENTSDDEAEGKFLH